MNYTKSLKPKLNYSVKNPSKFKKHKEEYLKCKTEKVEHDIVYRTSYFSTQIDKLNIGIDLLSFLKDKHPRISYGFRFHEGDINSIVGYGDYQVRYEVRGLHNHLLIDGIINLIIIDGNNV